MAFAGARWSEEVDHFSPSDDVKLGERGDALMIQRWLEAEIEAFEGFDRQWFGCTQRDIDVARLTHSAFFAEKAVDRLYRCDFTLLRLLYRAVKRFERARHL